mmetsp:Transcript_34189/g.80506  ORF Transcript_34189/g.80506 Transcript_34189/m.80506 type:complete len:1467 (-) Transcript_34189:90-4490(-)
MTAASNDTSSSIMRSCEGDSTKARHLERASLSKARGVSIRMCTSIWIASVLLSVCIGDYYSLLVEAISFSSSTRASPSGAPTSFAVNEKTRNLQQEEDWSTPASSLHPTSSPTSSSPPSSLRSTKKAKKHKKKEKNQIAATEDATLPSGDDIKRRSPRRGSSTGQRQVVPKQRPGTHGANPAFGLKTKRRREESIGMEGSDASNRKRLKSARQSTNSGSSARGNTQRAAFVRDDGSARHRTSKTRASITSAKATKKEKSSAVKKFTKHHGSKRKKVVHGKPSDKVQYQRERILPSSSLESKESSVAFRRIPNDASKQQNNGKSLTKRRYSNEKKFSRTDKSGGPHRRKKKSALKKEKSRPKAFEAVDKGSLIEEDRPIPPDAMQASRRGRTAKSSARGAEAKDGSTNTKIPKKKQRKKVHAVGEQGPALPGPASIASASTKDETCNSAGEIEPAAEAAPVVDSIKKDSKSTKRTKRRKKSSSKLSGEKGVGSPPTDTEEKQSDDETIQVDSRVEAPIDVEVLEGTNASPDESSPLPVMDEESNLMTTGVETLNETPANVAVDDESINAADTGIPTPLETGNDGAEEAKSIDVELVVEDQGEKSSSLDEPLEQVSPHEDVDEIQKDESKDEEEESGLNVGGEARVDEEERSQAESDEVDEQDVVDVENAGEKGEDSANDDAHGDEIAASDTVEGKSIAADENEANEEDDDTAIGDAEEGAVDEEEPTKVAAPFTVEDESVAADEENDRSRMSDSEEAEVEEEEPTEVAAPGTIEGDSAEKVNEGTTVDDAKQGEVDEEEPTEVAALGTAKGESEGDEVDEEEPTEVAAPGTTEGEGDAEGAESDEEEKVQISAGIVGDESSIDENEIDEHNEDNADSDIEEDKIDEENTTHGATDADQGKVPTDDKDADEKCEDSMENIEEGIRIDESAGVEEIEDEVEADPEDSNEIVNTENVDVESSQRTLEESETASEADGQKQENETSGGDSGNDGPDLKGPNNKYKGMVDPEQDVVSFIEEVLQENVRSWIEDTSVDSNIENIVNKTRGGHSDSGNEGAVSDSGLNEDDERFSSSSDVMLLERPMSDDSKFPAEEPNEKPLMKREELKMSGDKESDAVVSVVTWNLAEDSPSEEDAAFIRKFRENGISPGQGSDLVLISGQECENIKPRRSEGRRSREYRRLMIKMLGQDYVPVALHLLGGIQFGLFAKKSFLKEIEDVTLTDVTCGIGNVLHNKGAIAAFVKVKARNDKEENKNRSKSLRMVFVTAHLAAHVKNAKARDSDFWRISSELEAQVPEGFLPRKVGDQDSSGSFLFDSVDRVFFCGDLNYRLDLPRELTEYTLLHETEYDQPMLKDLLRHDQLVQSMAEGRAFPAFGEGKITFMPTFKYDKESNSYDTSHKQRIPAWTDRILFQPADGIRVLDYQSVPAAQSSDHRPVYGSFRIGMEGRVIPPSLKKRKRKRLQESYSYHERDY